MNNPRIGHLAGQLSAMEDARQRGSDRYAATAAEYEALKSAPENWPDVRASKWTAEQRACAIASGLVDGNGRSKGGQP